MLAGRAIRPGRQGGGSLWAWDGAFRRYRGLSTPFTDGRGGRKAPRSPHTHPRPPHSCLKRPFELASALCSGYEGAQTGDLKLPTVGLGFGLFLSLGFQGEHPERTVPTPGPQASLHPLVRAAPSAPNPPRRRRPGPGSRSRPGPPAPCLLATPSSWKTLFP